MFWFANLLGLISIAGVMVLCLFFVPMWIVFLIVAFVGFVWMRWYLYPGRVVLLLLLCVFVIAPMALSWAIQINLIDPLNQAYQIFNSIVPDIPFIPLLTLDFYPTLTVTYNIPPELIVVMLTVAYFFMVLIRIIKQTRQALYLMSNTVYAGASATLLLAFINFILRGFWSIDLFTALEAYLPLGLMLYHVIFNILPLMCIGFMAYLVFKYLTGVIR